MTQYRSLMQRLRHRALPAFAMTRVGRWLFTGPIAKVDKIIMPLSKGRLQLAVGHRVCLLRARGARSGELRVTPVIYTRSGTR